MAFFVWLLASDWRAALLRLEVENERIRESHARIDKLAFHDSLTGLPNRLLARDRFEQAMALARRNQTSVALLYLDLDDFKAVNDSLGHSSGDLLLCDVAQRLNQAVRASDTVSRQGGDEFLIACADRSLDESAQLADTILFPVLVVPIANNAGRNVGGENALTTLAAGTGGRVFTPTLGAQLDRAFDDILRELRTQYLIGFYPKDVPPAKDRFHTLKVTVPGALPGGPSSPPASRGLRVSTRSGYYGEANEGRPGFGQ